MDQAQQADLEVQPGLQRGLHVLEQVQRDLEVARQIVFRESGRSLRQLLLLAG